MIDLSIGSGIAWAAIAISTAWVVCSALDNAKGSDLAEVLKASAARVAAFQQ